jgi:hypothetical protein
MRGRLQITYAYALIPVSDDLSTGFRDISYSQLAHAVYWCTLWLQTEDRFATITEPFVYIDTQGLRYPILLLAMAKTGPIVGDIATLNRTRRMTDEF